MRGNALPETRVSAAVTPPGNVLRSSCRTCQETPSAARALIERSPLVVAFSCWRVPEAPPQVGLRVGFSYRWIKKESPSRGPQIAYAALAEKGALAVAAVIAIALNARGGPIRTLARRLALPERHLEPIKNRRKLWVL
jgi:hypothetical protein